MVAARGSITQRTTAWAVGQLRREHATVHGLARQLGTSWKTVWRAIEPELVRLAADESRFENVTTPGVDEHVWHHVDPRKRGPKELTGMVDLTRDAKGRTRARLLDLVPGRSGAVYKVWLDQRGDAFREGVKIAEGRTPGGSPADVQGLRDVHRLTFRRKPGSRHPRGTLCGQYRVTPGRFLRQPEGRIHGIWGPPAGIKPRGCCQ